MWRGTAGALPCCGVLCARLGCACVSAVPWCGTGARAVLNITVVIFTFCNMDVNIAIVMITTDILGINIIVPILTFCTHQNQYYYGNNNISVNKYHYY